MKDIKNKFIPFVLFILAAAATVAAQDSKVPSAEAKKSIEVAKFNIKEGIEFPAAALDVMSNEIVDELIKLKKFSQVKLTAPAIPTTTEKAVGEVRIESPAAEVAPKVEDSDLLLTGTITKFDAGSRAKRYLIGFGAGKTKIVAAIKIIERASGKVLLERDVDGKVIMGIFGGDSNGATRGLAKEVASTTKKAIFK